MEDSEAEAADALSCRCCRLSILLWSMDRKEGRDSEAVVWEGSPTEASGWHVDWEGVATDWSASVAVDGAAGCA